MNPQATYQRSNVGWHIRFYLISIIIALGSNHGILGQATKTSLSDSAPVILGAGSIHNREISGSRSHRYQLVLTEGQFANVIVKQLGIDVTLRLMGSDGSIVAEVDSHNSTDGSESISIATKPAGTYLIDVFPTLRKAEQGSYSITLSDLRPAQPNEALQFEALLQHYESIRLLLSGGQNDRALELAKASLETRERILGAENQFVAESLVALGRIYTSKNNIVQAETHITRALELLGKTTGKETSSYADGLFALGKAVSGRGDTKAAETYMRQALSILEKLPGKGGLRTAIVLSNLGLLYRALTDFRQGELVFRRALEICENTVGEDHLETANVLNNLGLMYNAAGDYPNAEKEMLRSLAIIERLFNPANRDVAIALNNLGLIEWRKGDHLKAEGFWKRALDIFEKVNGPESDGVANVLSNLGIIYKEYYKDYARAEAAQKRSLAIIEKLYGENSVSAGVASASLGLIYRSLGDYAQAESFTLRALKIYEKSVGPNHQNAVLALSVLAQLTAMRGDISASLAYQRRIETIEGMGIQTNVIMGSERQKIAFFFRLRSADKNVSFLVNLAPTSAESRDLVVAQTLQRKGRILDALAQNLSEFRRRASAEDEALLVKLNDITSEISKVTMEGRKNRSQAEYETYVGSLLLEREKVEAEISRRTAGSFVPTKPVELSAIRSAIPNGSALIEFAVYRPFEWTYSESKEPYGEPHYIVFVIRSTGDIRWRDLGAAKDIDKAVGDLRGALRDPGRSDVTRLARILDRKVMAPVRELTANASHLIVSPDGELNLVPFATLVDENSRYLVQRFSFTYVSTGRDLLRMPKRAGNKDVLVFSNPAFGEPSDLSGATNTSVAVRPAVAIRRSLSDTYFAPLAGTAGEAAAIKTIFPEASIMSGSEATETSLKQVSAPGILHIATHGFFLNSNTPVIQHNPKPETAKKPETRTDNPLLRSGLALAGANRRGEGQPKDDGIFTALEATGLNLGGTKLVVLSACDTGLGEVRNGEGVYGLRRAFVLAGAESLVMSLWPVSDYSTRTLMTNYYKNLKQGMGRGAALREVQLSMLRRNKQLHPFYWANFIQSGEWANLDGKR
jgi:CHAT domain-containing protein/tetratricopeptide (TPR) repeat protein